MPVSRIIDRLEVLVALHHELSELGERKRQALVRNAVNDLAACVNKEKKLAGQISETEKQWVDALKEWAQAHGIGTRPGFTMQEVTARIDPEQDRARIVQLQSDLLGTIQQIQEQNATNRMLIEQSLELVDFTLDLLAGDTGQEATYRNPAKVQGSGSGRNGKGNSNFNAWI